MHFRHTVGTLATAVVLLALTACQSAAPDPSDRPGSTAESGSTAAPGSPVRPDSTAARTPTRAGAAVLPDLVGQDLQAAQDGAQAAGFYALRSHDALGRGRNQVLDRNWKVCSQAPRPGSHRTDTSVDFATVKSEESCPASDAAEPPEAGDTMPNLIGKSVKVARESLPDGAAIEVRDSTGQDRAVLVGSNWKVCHLSPAAGATLTGKTITISAAKFDEAC